MFTLFVFEQAGDVWMTELTPLANFVFRDVDSTELIEHLWAQEAQRIVSCALCLFDHVGGAVCTLSGPLKELVRADLLANEVIFP